MDAALKPGFYVDPDTNRTFYLKIVNGKPLIPVWVKSKPEEWKSIKEGGKNK